MREDVRTRLPFFDPVTGPLEVPPGIKLKVSETEIVHLTNINDRKYLKQTESNHKTNMDPSKTESIEYHSTKMHH